MRADGLLDGGVVPVMKHMPGHGRTRLDTHFDLPLVEAGADILIPAGGIPMLLFSKIHDHRVGAAPVINGIPIVVKMTEMAVKLRQLTGLGVSRVSDYVKAPDHVIEEFLTHPKGL